jgi:hypothetical protein
VGDRKQCDAEILTVPRYGDANVSGTRCDLHRHPAKPAPELNRVGSHLAGLVGGTGVVPRPLHGFSSSSRQDWKVPRPSFGFTP